MGASSIKGIGTTYYGKCDYRADRSYITTEWFILLYVPVFPIRSHRVRPVEAADVIIPLIYQSEAYAHYDTTRPHLGQVLRTYLATFLLIFVWIPLVVLAAIRVPEGPYGINLMVIIASFLPMLIPVGLRQWAKHRARVRA